jgi:hypothetical protein
MTAPFLKVGLASHPVHVTYVDPGLLQATPTHCAD